VICPNCTKDNPDHAIYCLNCGSRLLLTCLQCGTGLPQGAKFCLKCGSRIPEREADQIEERFQDTYMDFVDRFIPKEYADRLKEASSQISPERRLVTILFSDIKGSTTIAEGLDPEIVLEVMNGAFEVLIEPVIRYEGTLARLMGDAVLAFFGAPISHENDPERAIRAGLDIVAGAQRYAGKLLEEQGIKNFDVRVGINTGQVVIGEVGTDLRVEYTAIGDAINLAARLESNATPGTVLISGATHEHVTSVFESQALGDLEVAGRVAPVPTYRVVGLKAIQDHQRGIPGLDSPLVGRKDELSQLEEVYERLKLGVGGIVTVIGEAGIGKSRLVAEMRNAVSSDDTHWVEGHCQSFSRSMAYQYWIDISLYFVNKSGGLLYLKGRY